MKTLAAPRAIPRDVPLQHLQALQTVIHAHGQSSHPGERRLGLSHRSRVFTLHSGLRLNEVRHLKLQDVEWTRRLLRIEQSKGLNDRLVPVTQTALDAVACYLAIPGPAADLPDHVFIHQHTFLSMNVVEPDSKRMGLNVA